MAETHFPLHQAAVVLPLLACPAFILCIPPFIWHWTQRNIAAWSLVGYLVILNLFNFINPLIWPRDNVQEWYNGAGLCDIEVRFFIAMGVGLPACTAMIMRKLARIMDTENITLIPSRNRVIREKVLEGLVCWGFPLFLVLVYYVIQPIRYFIFGITGCITAFNLSWVSVVLWAMWPPLTTVVAAYYAGLLVYRLYRYRSEFNRLIAIQDTTRSRFLRLFIMSMIIVAVLVPYSFWILWLFASQLSEDFNWSAVHGPDWDQVITVPSNGVVRADKWGQVAAGYAAFFMFGTGSDADNTYKRVLCAFGLNKIFPSLNERTQNGSSTTSRLWTWCSSYGSKARTLLSKNDSITETVQSKSISTIHSEGVDTVMLTTSRSGSLQPLQPVSTNDPILPHHSSRGSDSNKFFLGRLFTRRNPQQTVLPLFGMNHVDELTVSEKSPADTLSPGVYSHAWASDSPTTSRAPQSAGTHGVHVVKEVHQEDNLTGRTST